MKRPTMGYLATALGTIRVVDELTLAARHQLSMNQGRTSMLAQANKVNNCSMV